MRPLPNSWPVRLSGTENRHKARLPLEDAVNRRGVDVEGPGNGADRFPVSDQFLGRFLLIWLYFLWPSESDASRLGSQSAIGLFGFPQLHAGTPKASQNILLKWPLPHGYFAGKKPLNFRGSLTFRKCQEFRIPTAFA